MCGRFNVMTSAQGFVDLLQVMVRIEAGLSCNPNYNVAPTQDIIAIRQESAQDEPKVVKLRWGLIPHWSKDMSIGYKMINARSETAASKPAFRHAYKFSRCLIAADGWYEWRKISTVKQPYNIRRKDRAPMFFAGLWERWRTINSEGESMALDSCTVLTAEAMGTLRYIHPRMPVVLEPGLYEQWIDSSLTKPDEVGEIVRRRPTGIFEAYPVSTYVNKPANNSTRCLEPISISDVNADTQQKSNNDMDDDSSAEKSYLGRE